MPIATGEKVSTEVLYLVTVRSPQNFNLKHFDDN